MASTQTLTELPVIQYTGMDYETVISQIQEIINNNKNWKSNWTQFQNSEAGTLLIQLMAWISDNLAIRQDLLYNEQFLSTATSSSAKLRLLNQIGYTQETTSSAIVPIEIDLTKISTDDIEVSCCRENNSISSIKNSILKFLAKDINGKLVTWEILHVNTNGSIDYETPIRLSAGSANYKYYKKGTDNVDYQLKAVQGNTYYKEFYSDTSDGPIFDLNIGDFDLKTLVVYDTSTNKKHIKVDNFIELSTIENNTPCYVVEKNDNGSFQIRYESQKLIDSNIEMLNNGFVAGTTIGVLYRTSNGDEGNIPANYWSVSSSLKLKNSNNKINVKINNILSGYNGENGETLDDAVLNAPLSIKTMDRAVTVEDFDRILKKNNLVLSAKTYTPDNEPSGFLNYYGRRINPQEAFAIALLNKNFNDISGNDLNYFPWIETNKSHYINEKYSFGEIELNKEVQVENNYGYNTYIETIKNLKNIENDYTNIINDHQYKFINNTLLINTDSLFIKHINEEKLNALKAEDDEDKLKAYVLKIKTHKDKTEEKFINNISNELFEDNENTCLKTNHNIISEDYNATYTATNNIETINVFNKNDFTIVLDDNIKLNISPINYDSIKSDLEKINVTLPTTEQFDTTKEAINSILYTEEYYILVDRTDIKTIDDKISEAGTQNKYYWEEFLRNKESAAYKKSLIELINEAYDNFKNLDNVEGEDVEIASTDNFYFDEENKVLYKKQENGKYKKVDNSIGEGEKLNEVQEPFISTSLLNNVNFNFGLQVPYSSLAQNINEIAQGSFEEIELNGKTLPNYFFAENDALMDQNNNMQKHYYRFKLNDKIYAFEIDYDVISKAVDFYNALKVNGTNSYAYDIFKYVGLGKYIAEPWEGISDETLNDAAIQLNGYYSYRTNTCNLTNKKADLSDSEYNAIYNYGGKVYHYLTLDRLAMVLNYIVSPLNKENYNYYKFVDGNWVHPSENELSNLHFSCIEKTHYNYNSCITQSSLLFDEDKYINDVDYDLRAELIGEKNISFSSVLVDEIKSVSTEQTIDGVKTEDFLERIFGVKRNYNNSINAAEVKKPRAKFNDGLIISSPTKGINSSIYIKSEVLKDGETVDKLIFNQLGIVEITTSKNNTKTNKAFGVRREELYIGDDLTIENQNSIPSSREVYNSIGGDIKDYVTVGDILLTDNDLNFVNVNNNVKYISYLLTETNSVELYKSKNFLYSYDEKTNDLANPIVSGIEGQTVYKNKSGNYQIDKKSSNYNVIITSEPVKDTNSVYLINDTKEYLKNDLVYLSSESISAPTESYNKVNLMFSIDEDEVLDPSNYASLEDLGSFINVEIDLSNINANTLYKEIKAAYEKKTSSTFENNYAEKSSMLIQKDMKDSSKIILRNLDRRSTGNITFYYPISEDNIPADEESVNALYKVLFGTNYTNNNLYGLYNAENILDYNNSSVIHNIKSTTYDSGTSSIEDIQNGTVDPSYGTVGNTSEYFLAPSKGHPLKFVFRDFVDEDETESRYGDYYISCTGSEFYANNEDYSKTYRFSIVKTEHSTIPETSFYVSYVNDRSYETGRNTEEDSINEYMSKYMIAGTELKFIKPYFKTFDIVGTVYYSSNFDVSTVKENVTKVLEDKYKINNIKNISVGNKIYLSDIIKTISSVDGVSHVVINYFGYDATNKDDYPTTNTYLSIEVTKEFYTMSLLANTDNNHGLQLGYERSDVD